MVLLLDNYDSFTYNLGDYIKQCGAKLSVIRNDEFDLATLNQYSAVVISPGPGIPENAGITMELLKQNTSRIPIFGVCLGMQAIALHCGGQLKKGHYPMHGKVSSLDYHKDHPLFNHIDSPFEVCRYHSLVVDETNLENVTIIARSKQNEAMALVHNALPLWGVQFHPEAILTLQGMQLIQNWINYFKLK